MSFKIDAIIPTLNAERQLSKCLRSIDNMEESEYVNKIIVDAGSNDNTLEIAKEFNCEIHVKRGMYSNGINGARNYGLSLNKTGYYWQVDSDNEFIERDFLINILEPLECKEDVQISNPLPSMIDNSHSFYNFLTMLDFDEFSRVLEKGKNFGNYVVIDDLDYGLNNGCVIRSSALKAVGGYDFDIRTLTRMRQKGLSKAAVVKIAHYKHYSNLGILDYGKKLQRRVKLYSTHLVNKDEFIFTINLSGDKELKTPTRSTSVAQTIAKSFRKTFKEKNMTWVWGILFPIPYISVAITSPIKSLKVYTSFSRVN